MAWGQQNIKTFKRWAKMSHLEVVKVIVADVYADAEVEASISKM